MFNNMVVQPFALTDAEIEDIEKFASKNELYNIQRLCQELRSIRAAYLTMCKRAGMNANNKPDPNLVRLEQAKSAARRHMPPPDENPNDLSDVS